MKKKVLDICKTIDIEPFDYAISVIGGKWKMHVFFCYGKSW
ncbi:hypothetical protein [Longibaculum muris]|nr:hypothetical protein [Longibaculum muris]